MQISEHLNKFYAVVVSEANALLEPSMPQKEFRDYLKELNPRFPKKDGIYLSIKDITSPQMSMHISFIKTMLLKQGYQNLSIIDHRDYETSLTTRYKAKGEVAGEHPRGVKTYVICSHCGSRTLRVLSPERLQELQEIEKGTIEESQTYLRDTFLCIYCTK